ncbi:XRE family transcriptional regulator [Streptomyces sp. NPDC003077]|uniref:XRE family transcriptional regulator n=1 Tax=Streptomyces sp. NPDC003077 TaxID=3154443 RepID=UPI0033A1E579
MSTVTPERRWTTEADKPSDSVPQVTVTVTGPAPKQFKPLQAPDTPLGRARLAQGWSQERTVRALLALADHWGWQVAAENSLKVQLSRWENEIGRPGDTYQVLFCALYRMPPEALGFTASARSAVPVTRATLQQRVEVLEAQLARLVELTEALLSTQRVAP